MPSYSLRPLLVLLLLPSKGEKGSEYFHVDFLSLPRDSRTLNTFGQSWLYSPINLLSKLLLLSRRPFFCNDQYFREVVLIPNVRY
ncbi:hypothetical protein NEOLEDRAFT_1105414 [Neolentinus lepideus HHB14362 ss-1]|uniref:Secreted protein n=1 Tax=Neolentinus lepideus HHB14362 ss-1 TaxID=1314782 RepID=A0A165WCI6_9AGAM|nr:hypothetical protein NEOLEDRAFT_1105414 [Neolentinus lepideus HHB14362 ss-1]